MWRWAHANKLDYPTGKLLPRGPMPAKWMEYRGHYLHDDSVVLSYTINGTEILESPAKAGGFGAIVAQPASRRGEEAAPACRGSVAGGR